MGEIGGGADVRHRRGLRVLRSLILLLSLSGSKGVLDRTLVLSIENIVAVLLARIKAIGGVDLGLVVGVELGGSG